MNIASISEILTNLTRLFLVRVGAVVLVFISQAWIIKLFGSQEYGDFVYFITLTSLVVVLSKGGLDVLLLKRIAVEISRGQNCFNLAAIRRKFLRLGIIIAITVSVVVFGLATKFDLVNKFNGELSWLLFLISSVLMVVLQLLLGFDRGRGEIVSADLYEQIVRVASMLLLVAGFFLLKTPDTISLQTAYAGSFLITAYLVYRRYLIETESLAKISMRVDSDSIRIVYSFRQHIAFTASGLLTFIFFQMDGLVLSHHVSSTELGAYNMACNVARFVIFLPMIILAIFQPKVAVAFGQSDRSGLVRYFVTTLSLCLSSAIVSACAFALCGQPILEAIDPALGVAYPALQILLVVYLFNSVLMVIGAFAVLSKSYWKLVVAQTIGAMVTASSYFALVTSYGQIGVACSVVSGLFFVIFSSALLFRTDVVFGLQLIRKIYQI